MLLAGVVQPSTHLQSVSVTLQTADE